MGDGVLIQRYFVASETDYEAARLAVDASLGYPSERAQTIWSPAASGIVSEDGRLLLALLPEFCDRDAVAAVLHMLTEITEDEYRALLPPDPEVE